MLLLDIEIHYLYYRRMGRMLQKKKERRSKHRISLQSGKLQNKATIYNVVTKGKITEGELLNINTRGFCLKVKRPFHQLELVKVKLPISSGLNINPTFCEVIWTNPENNETESYVVGFKFVMSYSPCDE